MGGSVSSVQAPQTGGQSSGKGGSTVQSPAESGFRFGSRFGSQIGREEEYRMNAINAEHQRSNQWQPPQSQQPATPQPMGKGGYTNSATSGQPRIGQENQYSNTVGQWDNSQIQPVQRQGGKGKGA